ncbi:MAG: PorT family protein [Prevotellaceae bacterium]|jgi:hypothetical protein|nr:PorT family protein [Prevotellaceae bacterium]
MKNKYVVIVLLFVSFAVSATVKAQHYVGIKDAYGIMGIATSPDLGADALTTVFNPGIVYRYEHKKYFAIQTELNYLAKGYKLDDITHRIYSYELPLLAQGFVRLGWFRPYVTGGAFVGYIYKRKLEMDGKNYKYKTDNYDNRFEYGIVGGAGMAFAISRFELQLEWRYQHAFSFLRDPHIEGTTQYINSTQMMISLTLFYCFGK